MVEARTDVRDFAFFWNFLFSHDKASSSTKQVCRVRSQEGENTGEY
jgi:hypothetical protein